MSMTLSLSEFNRNPSLVTRLAKVAPVTITNHGLPAFELRVVAPPSKRTEALVGAGILTPPRSRSTEPLPDFCVDPLIARAIVASFENDRAAYDY